MKIVIISVFKESLIGGVAQHSTNVYKRLLLDKYDVNKVDISIILKNKMNFFIVIKRIFTFHNYKIFHFHTSAKSILFYLLLPILKVFRKKVILSIHSGAYFSSLKKLNEFFNRIFFRYTDAVIFMNNKQAAEFKERYPHCHSKVHSIKPFIGPDENTIHNLKLGIYKKDHKCFRIIVMGLWNTLYNYEEVLDVLADISKSNDFNRILMVTFVVGRSAIDEDYRDFILKKISSYRCDKLTFEVLEDVDDTYSVIACQDLLIRPSKVDSYGLCIAEALYIGVPAIATNVCARCDNTMLYDVGDTEKLQALICGFIRNPRLNTGGSLLNNSEDSYDEIVALYKSM